MNTFIIEIEIETVRRPRMWEFPVQAKDIPHAYRLTICTEIVRLDTEPVEECPIAASVYSVRRETKLFGD